MGIVEEMKNLILAGQQIGKEEALALAGAPLLELTQAADEIRKACLLYTSRCV